MLSTLLSTDSWASKLTSRSLTVSTADTRTPSSGSSTLLTCRSCLGPSRAIAVGPPSQMNCVLSTFSFSRLEDIHQPTPSFTHYVKLYTYTHRCCACRRLLWRQSRKVETEMARKRILVERRTLHAGMTISRRKTWRLILAQSGTIWCTTCLR